MAHVWQNGCTHQQPGRTEIEDVEAARAAVGEGFCPICKTQFKLVGCWAGDQCACYHCPCCKMSPWKFRSALGMPQVH